MRDETFINIEKKRKEGATWCEQDTLGGLYLRINEEMPFAVSTTFPYLIQINI